MPELPEVETIVRCLRPHLTGLRIRDFKVFFPPLLRNEGRPGLKNLVGARIIGLRRRGKMILLDGSSGFSLLFHLKMTGQLLFCQKADPVDKHTHVIVSFESSSRELRFRDVRKFGFVRVIKTSRAGQAPEIRPVGPEPLDLDVSSLLQLFSGRRGRLKSLLLNQRFLAGIGNIYADEILFEARLHPAGQASLLGQKDLLRLSQAIPKILNQAIDCRGTSIRDFRDGDGLRGDYQSCLCVYGRESLPCVRCAAKIGRLRLSGRSSFFCPRCQRLKGKMKLREYSNP